MSSYTSDLLDRIQSDCEAHPERNNRLSIFFSNDLTEKSKQIDALEELEASGEIIIFAKALGYFGIELL